MIGRLTGRIGWRGADHVLLDVGGVGYVVHVSERTLAALPGVGEPAALYTELLVREDLLQLYGFVTLQEREWHRLLTSVQGIGAKAAQAILGALGADGVSRAIALGDWAAIRAAPGVGPKLAQRVVNELKGRAADVMAMGTEDIVFVDTSQAVPDGAPAPGAPPGGAAGALSDTASRSSGQSASAQADALSALVNLGYGQGEAASAVAEAAADPRDGAADKPGDLIRAALKLLAPKG
jgi:Holliday junction DNA helicase RuvA